MSNEKNNQRKTIQTLPCDDARHIMWRFADRFDLQMLMQSARSVARGQVARVVADGARNTHDWTESKKSLLKAFDESGITSLFMAPEHGGYIEGPKNFALAIAAFELAWVDGGAATSSLAGNLALEPIHECGTPEQKAEYMGGAIPPQPGEDRVQKRGAFALTEPLPFVGVETGMLCGKVSIDSWEEGKEPILKVEKRGRFITNMDFANFACCAVDTDDDRIKSSCMIILNEDDEGVFDRGAPVLKMVHQLSSTRDPIFSMKVPASRIIGGYKIEDGKIVPTFNNSEVIDAVFKRTRVTVGLMSSAKVLSAIEPVIRYHRERFRGGALEAGSPRFNLGIQQKEDAVQRLAKLWAFGEASSSLGFESARIFDDLEPLEKEKNRIFEERGIQKGRAAFKELMKVQKDAIEYLDLVSKGENTERTEKLKNDPLVRYSLVDSVANVLCPAGKLWNTGNGATMMREAVSLVGGYGITEDCPGFLGQKWFDTQLEATYEGPEAVQRRQLSITMTNKLFLKQFDNWIQELKDIAKTNPEIGADTVAKSMELWKHTLEHLQNNKDDNGQKIYSNSRHGASYPLTDALCYLLASRYQIMDILELQKNGHSNPVVSEGLEGMVNFFSDLSTMQASSAAGFVLSTATELFYGFHKTPDTEKEAKFTELTRSVSRSQAGACFAKDRAGEALTQIMIPEALDYPM